MIEKGKQNSSSFHLAGIVPVAGQPLNFDFPWHDCMQPIARDYLAVERAVWECAYAGCETIWVVCHDEMQPLIKYRLGSYVHDPINYFNSNLQIPTAKQREIPIYYVPIHPKDRDKRDCLGWSVLYGALTSYWLSKTISIWTIPDKFYVAFPYGVYQPEILKASRRKISSKKAFFLSYNNKTVKNGEYLGFTFDADDFKACYKVIREEGTGEYDGYKPKNPNAKRLSKEERWSARFFSLDKIFNPVKIEDVNLLELSWYYNIDNWDNLRAFLAAEESGKIKRPHKKLLGYHEWNPIGVNNEEE